MFEKSEIEKRKCNIKTNNDKRSKNYVCSKVRFCSLCVSFKTSYYLLSSPWMNVKSCKMLIVRICLKHTLRCTEQISQFAVNTLSKYMLHEWITVHQLLFQSIVAFLHFGHFVCLYDGRQYNVQNLSKVLYQFSSNVSVFWLLHYKSQIL